MKALLKRLLPTALHHLYNRVVSKRKIRARYGDWFDLEWKRKATAASESDWQQVYDRSWEEVSGQDLSPLDLQKIGALIPDGSSVLDAGCGDGYLLASLAGRNLKLTGVDLSKTAIVRARERLGASVELQTAFLEHLPFADNAFDVVVSAHTLEHVRDLDVAVKELTRVCHKKLIILTPRQKYIPYTEDYHLQFFPEEADLRRSIPLPGATVEMYEIPPGVCLYNGEVWLMWGEVGENGKRITKNG